MTVAQSAQSKGFYAQERCDRPSVIMTLIPHKSIYLYPYRIVINRKTLNRFIMRLYLLTCSQFNAIFILQATNKNGETAMGRDNQVDMPSKAKPKANAMAGTGDNTVIRSFKYKLLPSKKQHKEFDTICESQRILYNACLQERIACYEKTGKGRPYIDQCKAVTELRQELEYSNIPANIQRWTLKRIDDAYNGFFRRVKSGENAGFPRFRGKGRWQSFGFAEFSGVRLVGNKIKFRGLSGSLRVHMHRPLPKGKILCCAFIKSHKGWYISLQIRMASNLLSATGNRVGIDVGLIHLAALSTGETIPNIRTTRKAAKALRCKSRALARCKKSSKRRAKIRLILTRCHAKIKNTRATYLHQISARLVRENDLIAVEKLNNKGLASGRLAKHVNDAAWAKLKRNLLYKAENAGRAVIEVPAQYTSQECPQCGNIKAKTLSERVHECGCGCVMDRDVAAAKIILTRACTKALETQRKAA